MALYDLVLNSPKLWVVLTIAVGIQLLQTTSSMFLRTSDPLAIAAGNGGNVINDEGQLFDIPSGTFNTLENDIIGNSLEPADFERALQLPDPNAGSGTSQRVFNPIELAGLFQGDIRIPVDTTKYHARKSTKGRSSKWNSPNRNAIQDLSKKWVNNSVAYVLSRAYKNVYRAAIARAFLEIENVSCIRFTPRSTETDYIHILMGDGCSSVVGRQGGPQEVSIGVGCNQVGIIIHEIFHALGFWHEQSRPDRDKYIIVHWENILPEKKKDFEQFNWNIMRDLGIAYDRMSIMHYSSYVFAKDRSKPTITAIGNKLLGLGQKLTPSDVKRIKILYECDNFTTPAVLPNAIVDRPGKSICEDTSVNCWYWEAHGECTNNPTYMKINCPESCGLCGNKKCRDQNLHCGLWKTKGECEMNPKYMNFYCMKTCNKCK